VNTPALSLRVSLALAALTLIGWTAWRSIPTKQISFSDQEFATNRQLAGQARFTSPPASISAGYVLGENGVQLSRGGSIQYDLAQTEGYFRGVFQVADKTGGKIQINAQGPDGSVVLIERTLAPSKQDVDGSAFHFLINLKTLPSGTNHLLLTTANGVVNWRETGLIDGREYAGLANIPLEFLAADGFLPGWDGKIMTLQSPARLIFRVPVGKHLLTFRNGINPAMFSDPKANTDGVGFKVELAADGKMRELSNRTLEPYSRPADRELQSISLNLDGPGQLFLTATPGSASNINWDWSVWQDFRLD
jgi:hypothetical protein